MSSDSNRPRFVLWVPDLASETGWTGVQVKGEQPKPPRKAEIGFKAKPQHG